MDSSATKPDYLYRSGVGIVIVNSQKQIFIGKRIDNKGDAWQMPQGGLDAGEDEDIGMFRELKEETGIRNAEIITKSKECYYYNLPYNLQKKFWGGLYLGQRQRWYLVKFLGNDDEICIDCDIDNSEFSEWRWADKKEVMSSIVSFKKPLYTKVMNEFMEYFHGN